eukprot:scaffold35177_cov64-Phaeocystis_antarctica.AAC.1
MRGEVWAGRREGRGPAAAHERRARREGPGFVTLDVSKLSGWLNALAYCRVESRACAMRSEVWDGGWRAWAGYSARAACTARGPGCEG